MQKRWQYKRIPSYEQIEKISNEININPYLAAILAQRGITGYNEARDFFRPSLYNLHDPFFMKDMHEAVDRLKTAITQKEKILVYGDYDVDGTTAVSLVFSYLRNIYTDCDIYIPDRYAEGYGISKQGIEWAENNGFHLIIALDCGIKAVDMIEFASGKGIDFII